MRVLGLRNIVTDLSQWRFLIFYDFDGVSPDWAFIDNMFARLECSYIAYQTKHGFHLVGLTPLTACDHVYLFTMLQEMYPNYYSGQTIRLSRKPEENQTPLFCKRNYGSVIPNLYNIFAKRFGLPFALDDRKQAVPSNKWRLVFEHYSTGKV